MPPDSATRSAAPNSGVLMGLPGPPRAAEKREPTPPPLMLTHEVEKMRLEEEAEKQREQQEAEKKKEEEEAEKKRQEAEDAEKRRRVEEAEFLTVPPPPLRQECEKPAGTCPDDVVQKDGIGGHERKKPLLKGARALTRALKSGEVARIVNKMEANGAAQDSEQDAAVTLNELSTQDLDLICKPKHAALVSAPTHESPSVAQLPTAGLSHSPSECPSPPTAPLGQALTAATATAIARAQSACEDLPEKFLQPVAETVERLRHHFEARRREARSKAQLVADEVASWPTPVPLQVDMTQSSMALQSSNLAMSIPQNFYLSPGAASYSTLAEHHLAGADVDREGDVTSSEGEADLTETDFDAEMRLSKAVSRLGRQLGVLEEILTIAERAESSENHKQEEDKTCESKPFWLDSEHF